MGLGSSILVTFKRDYTVTLSVWRREVFAQKPRVHSSKGRELVLVGFMIFIWVQFVCKSVEEGHTVGLKAIRNWSIAVCMLFSKFIKFAGWLMSDGPRVIVRKHALRVAQTVAILWSYDILAGMENKEGETYFFSTFLMPNPKRKHVCQLGVCHVILIVW